MQKKIFYLCLVGIAFVFQGCPGSINQPQTSVDRTTGFTFVLSPQDSIKVGIMTSSSNLILRYLLLQII